MAQQPPLPLALEKEKLRAGDEAAFKALFALLAPYVRSLAHYRGNPDVADVLDDVLLTVYRNRERVADLGDAQAILQYCYVLARNAAVHYSHRRLRELRAFESYKDEFGRIADRATKELHGNEQLRERLEQAIRDLPERQREVVALYLLEERGVDEVGRILGIQPTTVKRLYAEALRHLRDQLTERPEVLQKPTKAHE